MILILLEQIFFAGSNTPKINLQKGPGNFSGKTPNSEFDDGFIDQNISHISTTSEDKVHETFKKAAELHRDADSNSYTIAKKLHVDITGLGSGDILKTLRTITSIDQLSSVIASYNKLYKISLYDDISNEWSTSWNSVWLAIKRLNPNVSKFRVGTQMA